MLECKVENMDRIQRVSLPLITISKNVTNYAPMSGDIFFFIGCGRPYTINNIRNLAKAGGNRDTAHKGRTQ
jgi:hypothetical protein